ncbi:DSBA oxidoreductase [Variovorax paradoxus]|uniref:DSBA oxidoreductase n=2 Tax=Variovorax paradoxus TaxID=34073 RepID=A0A0D0N1T9_VARPD|nr:DSBA oxidoreductase [Variovorax paradoxus]
MIQPMKIDFISDVSCPWCAIGLHSLEAALERTRDVVDATIEFQPYELNPTMPPQGQNIVEHVAQKYGSTREQSEANRDILRARAADVGFAMPVPAHSRIYNTRDAHRLLHWAAGEGFQAELKHRLFDANFTENLNVSDPTVLADAAEKAGLNRAGAEAVLASDRFSREIQDAERMWRSRGIHSVPAILINGRHLISGGQPPEIFEQAIREIAAQA